MPQSHPPLQPIRHSQNIPEYVNLQPIKVIIYARLEQRLQLMHAVFDLCAGCRVEGVACFVAIPCCRVGQRGGVGGVGGGAGGGGGGGRGVRGVVEGCGGEAEEGGGRVC